MKVINRKGIKRKIEGKRNKKQIEKTITREAIKKTNKEKRNK